MPSIRECPKGYRLRKGYTRRFRQSIASSGYTVRRKGKVITVHPKTDSIHVPSGCIKERTHTQKSTTNQDKTRSLRKGVITSYGYQWGLADPLRHRALKKVIKEYGVLPVYNRLNTVATLSKKAGHPGRLRFEQDVQWISRHYSLTK